MELKIIKIGLAGLIIFAVTLSPGTPTEAASATTLTVLTDEKTSAAALPMLTFRFDDGLIDHYKYAAPILSQYNFPAVAYIFTDPPEQDDWEGYMNWAQIAELQNVYGWEIGGHSKSHPDLTQLFDTEIIEELSESKALLESHNLVIKSFASPFGYYDARVLSYIKKFYESHLSAWPYGFNDYPFNNYEISVQEVRGSTSLATVKSWIDTAVNDKKWLVLLFHGIVESNPGEYECSKNKFKLVVDYVNSKNVPVVTLSEALSLDAPDVPEINDAPATNLITNSGFESLTNNWADHWLRGDNSMVIDTNNNGSSVNPGHSLKFVGDSLIHRVRTEGFIGVDPNKNYNLKLYFNCPVFSAGGLDVFIDEYDASGNWLNWSWQTGIWSEFVGEKTASYTPKQGTAKLLVWLESAAGSGLTCYIDNVVLGEAD